MRLNFCLTRLGVCMSRRQADSLIRQGAVVVNGQLVCEPGQQIVPHDDTLRVHGTLVRWTTPPLVYWMLHKPRNMLVSRQGESNKETIFALPCLRRIRFPLFYVGRLDYCSEGLLLLTNDGELAHHLCHPSFAVEKTYHVLLAQRPTPQQEQLAQQGELLPDGRVDYFRLRYQHRVFLGKSHGYWYSVRVKEGRNRLIRRVFTALGIKVVRLQRIAYGNLRLPAALPVGKYRQLTKNEIVQIKKIAKIMEETKIAARHSQQQHS